MNTRLSRSLGPIVFTSLFFAAMPSGRAEKLFEYGFNGTGPAAASSADAKSKIGLMFLDVHGDTADLHGPKGSGVSGKPGDRAFDATSATGMGRGKDGAEGAAPEVNQGPVAVADEETMLLANLESYTIQGWFKTQGETLARVARLVSCTTNQGKTPVLDLGGNLGGGSLFFGATSAVAGAEPLNLRATPGAFSLNNEWVFFAITYANNSFSFYVGGTAETVARAGVTSAAGRTADLPSVVHIGNIGNRQRPFSGWMDNVRIYGAKTGESGALSLQDLEALRQRDVRGE